ncbi:hypothetical protein BT93_L5736 [Corymbia citriodora subsp. variegata]|uniref:Vacuolar protein-sorting-associated protein 25 n=1 Tax=Corymbia citriodora subsp. variegata TaxID=360336 RepID=A0A8T0CF22_CORYI|nr:hypothetical protein BT93_L5736 [Corymbia citriodora subsp. variegata]
MASTYSGTTTLVNKEPDSFHFPSIYQDYPPFFTLQTTLSTRTSQLKKWSRLIQRYCKFHRLFRLVISEHLDSPLFNNRRLNKRLQYADIVTVLDWMAGMEGGGRTEWLTKAKEGVFVYWRKPEEWANLIRTWVEDTGQKGSVLTLYELVEGETTEKEEFYGMDLDVLKKGLAALAKQGRAQVFGSEGSEGVKFF